MFHEYKVIFLIISIITNVAIGGSGPSRPSENYIHRAVKGQTVLTKSNELRDVTSSTSMKDYNKRTPKRISLNLNRIDNYLFSKFTSKEPKEETLKIVNFHETTENPFSKVIIIKTSSSTVETEKDSTVKSLKNSIYTEKTIEKLSSLIRKTEDSSTTQQIIENLSSTVITTKDSIFKAKTIESPSSTIKAAEDPIFQDQSVKNPSTENPSSVVKRTKDSIFTEQTIENPSYTKRIENSSSAVKTIKSSSSTIKTEKSFSAQQTTENPSSTIKATKDPIFQDQFIENPSSLLRNTENSLSTFKATETPFQKVKKTNDLTFDTQYIENLSSATRTTENPLSTVKTIESSSPTLKAEESLSAQQTIQNPSSTIKATKDSIITKQKIEKPLSTLRIEDLTSKSNIIDNQERRTHISLPKSNVAEEEGIGTSESVTDSVGTSTIENNYDKEYLLLSSTFSSQNINKNIESTPKYYKDKNNAMTKSSLYTTISQMEIEEAKSTVSLETTYPLKESKVDVSSSYENDSISTSMIELSNKTEINEAKEDNSSSTWFSSNPEENNYTASHATKDFIIKDFESKTEVANNNITYKTEETKVTFNGNNSDDSSVIIPLKAVSNTHNTQSRTLNNKIITENSRKASPQRVEYHSGETGSILWLCPPTSIPERKFKNNSFLWFKLGKKINNISFPRSNFDPIKNYLEIKNPESRDEGRYICIIRSQSLFVPTEVHFYQFIILKTKWVDIGSVVNVSLFFNQKLILNCPHGDIIRNETFHPSPCSSRITIIEYSTNTTKDVYRCSNSPKETIKLESLHSSTECSLDLLGCILNEEKDSAVNTDRCFHVANYSDSPWKVKRCSGKTFIRFYYDQNNQICLPFETDICGSDYYSFSSLIDCEFHCSLISTDIQPCLYPQNIDVDQNCEESSEGRYLASYNIFSNECEWFFHRENCPISKNVFTSEKKCQQTCIHNKNKIKMEIKKICVYKDLSTVTPLKSIQRWVYLPEINDCAEGNISLTGEPYTLSFRTKIGCSMCTTKSYNDICGTRPLNGECKKKEIKWHFNYVDGKCIRIFDGGCGESLNRFNTKWDCQKTCSKFIISSTTAEVLTSTKPSTFIIRTSKIASKTIMNRRVNRELPNFQERLVRTTVEPTASSVTPRAFDVSQRILDSDPCLGKPLLGNCNYGLNQRNYSLIRYSFVPEYSQCHRVFYSGCLGGENLFDDANDCKSACEYRLYNSLKSFKCQNPYIHNCVSQKGLQPLPSLKRYQYSTAEDKCLPFTSVDSQKCLQQFFLSIQDCERFCKPKKPSEAILQNKCYGKMVIDETSCGADARVQLWSYLPSIKQCLQYSTCSILIEGNVFLTRGECEDNCQAKNIFTVCSLPADPGMGTTIKMKYFYDNQRRKCRIFPFKGSMGNLNRFRTNEECTKVCAKGMSEVDYEPQASTLVEPIQTIDMDYQGTSTNVSGLNADTDREYCYDSHKYGACGHFYPQVFMTKYYYNAYKRQCEPYLFSGCGSTSRNSFDSIAICDKMCTARIQKTSSSICSRKTPRCSNSSWIYWRYNSERGICELFPSCVQQSSSEQFFMDEESCSRVCVPPLPLKKDLFDICHLPQTISQHCHSTSKRWFFDERRGSCVSFYGCRSYGNNFPSLAICMLSCEPQDPQDVCKLPEDSGPCTSNNMTVYSFNWESQQCTTFAYGGCLGNRNRFSNLKDCRAVCPSRNRCNIQTRSTGCRRLVENLPEMYLYNINENKCQKINESICGNYFDFYSSQSQCENDCVLTEEFKTILFNSPKKTPKMRHLRCSETLKFNSYPLCLKSEDWLPRFFYDEDKEDCVFFYYNGCDGYEDKGNRFTSLVTCRTTCTDNYQQSLSQTTMTELTTSTLTTKKEKKGVCPKAHNMCSNLVFVTNECKMDSDCSQDMKCCECEIGGLTTSQCSEPVGCMLSSYGCCTGTEKVANDTLHSSCSRTPTKCANIPENIELKEGQSELYIECLMSGDPRPNITWTHLESKRSIPTKPTMDLIKPMWSGVLRLSNSPDILSGVWVCRGINELGQDDIEVSISLPSKPFRSSLQLYDEFNLNSTSKYVALSSDTVIHCPIYGLPRPSIVWFFNNSQIKNGNDSIMVQNRYLFLNNVEMSNEGWWICKGNQMGKFLLFMQKLKVVEPLQILPSPHGNVIKAAIGQRVILYCNVIGKPRPNISWSWKKDGVVKKLFTNEKTDQRKIVIDSFHYENRGEYECSAQNNVSKEKMIFIVTPIDANDIVVEPSGFHFIGDHITLNCPAKPKEKIYHVLWKKDNVFMKTIGLKLNFILHSKLDSGFYTCHHGGRSYQTHVYVHARDPV